VKTHEIIIRNQVEGKQPLISKAEVKHKIKTCQAFPDGWKEDAQKRL